MHHQISRMTISAHQSTALEPLSSTLRLKIKEAFKLRRVSILHLGGGGEDERDRMSAHEHDGTPRGSRDPFQGLIECLDKSLSFQRLKGRKKPTWKL